MRFLLALALLLGCGRSDPLAGRARAVDGGGRIDAGAPDAGRPDAGPPPPCQVDEDCATGQTCELQVQFCRSGGWFTGDWIDGVSQGGGCVPALGSTCATEGD